MIPDVKAILKIILSLFKFYFFAAEQETTLNKLLTRKQICIFFFSVSSESCKYEILYTDISSQMELLRLRQPSSYAGVCVCVFVFVFVLVFVFVSFNLFAIIHYHINQNHTTSKIVL